MPENGELQCSFLMLLGHPSKASFREIYKTRGPSFSAFSPEDNFVFIYKVFALVLTKTEIYL